VIYGPPPLTSYAGLIIPLGPLGMGGFAIMSLGSVSRQIMPKTGTTLAANTGDFLYNLGLAIAYFFWAYGIGFLAIAVGIWAWKRFRYPFNMTWWAFIFPLGVYTLNTFNIGNELPSRFFKVTGLVLMGILVALWFGVVGMTVWGMFTGKVWDSEAVGAVEHKPRLKRNKRKMRSEEDVMLGEVEEGRSRG
jgi:tellurite resistance protein TehA-like permease